MVRELILIAFAVFAAVIIIAVTVITNRSTASWDQDELQEAGRRAELTAIANG